MLGLLPSITPDGNEGHLCMQETTHRGLSSTALLSSTLEGIPPQNSRNITLNPLNCVEVLTTLEKAAVKQVAFIVLVSLPNLILLIV